MATLDAKVENKKVPKMDKKTRQRVLELAFPTDGQQPLSAQKIWNQLDYENTEKGENYILTSVRSIQKYKKKVKLQETESMELDRQPWSLLLSDKAGIPFDPILLELLKLWFHQQVKRGQRLPFIPFPVGIAKWAVRLHKMAPFLSEDKKKLLYRARRYFAMERMAVLDRLPLDSSYDDLEIAIEGESDKELKVAYEEFYSHKVIKLDGEETQSQYGKVSEIIVPEDIAERIVSKKKKQRKSK